MRKTLHTILHTSRWPVLGVSSLVGILLLCSLLPASSVSANPTTSSADNSNNDSTVMYDGPNAVTGALSSTANGLATGLSWTENTLGDSGRTMASTLSRSGKATAHGIGSGAGFIGHGFVTTAAYTGRTISSGVVSLASVPGHIIQGATDAPVVSSLVRPDEQGSVPTIGSEVPVAAVKPTTAAVAASVVPAVTPAVVATQWPIHGAITTLFGVPELPYEAIHTGLDISDGWRQGVTPIRPFEPGRVTNVIIGNTGLGNHVIIDHGGGVTSVYGHMYSTSVSVGQLVDETTVLGTEGSTGVSTGTHLHFEIRVNGQAVDPHTFIPGQP